MGKSVNLGTKYASQIQQQFTTGSLLQGRLETNVDFVGARTVRVHTINTVPLQDYDRTASGDRYGVAEEVGDSVQELYMSQDKSFSAIIDKGNSLDQAINKAGQFVRAQIDEEVIPAKDRYGFARLAMQAGKIHATQEVLEHQNVLARMGAARAHMLNSNVPLKGRTWFVTSDVYDALVKTEQFRNIGQIGGKALASGQVGELFGSPVVEVPLELMPTHANFMLAHKSAAASPSKIEDTVVHIDPPGISGHKVEGRFYWDTFVFGAKANGVYLDILGNGDNDVFFAASPTYNKTTKKIVVETGSSAKYTLDGTDPRYSMSAVEGTEPPVQAGDTLKFYGYREGWYPSGVVSVKIT